MEIQTIVIRLLAATLCGGLLGLERERRKRPAGLRTYILVCIGSTLVMMTNIYIMEKYQTGDPTRLAAQVISGIGFLGAGTIIVTTRNRVRGLTTAAGLWASACMGIAIGAGFYVGALIGCLLVFIAMSVLHGLNDKVLAKSNVVNLYIEFQNTTALSTFLKYLRENNMKIVDIEVSRVDVVSDSGVAVLLAFKLPKRMLHETLLTEISTKEGITYLEEV